MITYRGVGIPELSDLPAPPKRVILHWTGGGPRANEVDRKAYHYVVNQDGAIIPGVHSPAANLRKLSGSDAYARHTGGFNSFSVGVSFAGMKGYAGRKAVGPFPLTRQQIDAGISFVATLCRLWKLDPLNPAHLFTHREAWTLHGVKGSVNHQKTDIEYLPHAPLLTAEGVGPYLRTAVSGELAGQLVDERLPKVTPSLATRERAVPAAPPIVQHVTTPPVPEATMSAVVVTPKPKRSSRTLLLNGATMAASGALLLGDALDLAAGTGIELPENIGAIVAFVLGAANWWLRTRTGQPLRGTAAARELGAE